MNTTTQATLENIAQFLYREARFLDDEQWDEWLSYLFTRGFFLDACMG